MMTSWLKHSSLLLRGLIVTPLIVTMLTSDEITVYYLFNTVLAFSPFLTSAVAGSYMRGFSYAWSGASSFDIHSPVKKNTPDFNFLIKIYTASNLIQLLMGLIVFILISAIGYFGLRNQIALLDKPSAAWISWNILTLCILFRVWINRDNSLIQGIGLVAKLNKQQTLITLIGIVLTAILLSLDMKFYAISLGTMIVVLMSGVLQKLIIKKTEVSQYLTKSIFPVDKSTYTSIWSASSRELMISILTMGINRASGIIASFFLVGGDLASYLHACAMIMIAISISLSPFFPYGPRFASLRSKGDIECLAKETGLGIRNSLYAFSLMVAAMSVGFPVMFEIIGANIPFLAPQYWLLISLSYFISRHTAMHSQILLSSNKVMFLREQIITGFIKLILMIVGAKYFGIMGIIIAELFSNLIIMSWYAPKIAWRSLGEFAALNRKTYVYHACIALILLVGVILNSEIIAVFTINQIDLVLDLLPIRSGI